MQSILIFIVLVIVSIILLITATVTSHWQIIGINQPPINTNIGLWKICSKSQGKSSKCQPTKVDSSHKFILYIIRFLSILSIIVAATALLLSNKIISLLLTGMTLLLAGLTAFLYSTQLENYFSEYFDKLMYSRYSYSYYLQSSAILILLVAILIRLHPVSLS